MSRDQAADQSEHEPQPGDVIADRYRVERKLGTGGMGVVLAAQHVALKQRVAIKLMLPDALRDATAVSRFMREAWAASKINSEYVTRVFDLGALPNGAPYLVMEYLEGYDLSARIKREGKLPLEDVLEIGLQVCEALAEAHALGIVHRDLKPSNIFCVRRSDGRTTIKVLDFGISKVTQERATADDLSLTRTLMLMGSPLYMSPEQMSSAKSVDARADVWSLGIILYELLSGRVPFRGESLPDLAVAIATQTPRTLSAVRPDLPKKLPGVVARCLEKNRDQRYANVAELALALSAFAAPPLAAHAERAERVLRNASVTLSTWGDEKGVVVETPVQLSDWREKGQPKLRLFAVAGATMALAAAGFWFWQSRAQLEPAEPHIVVPAQTRAVEPQAENVRVNGTNVEAVIPAAVQPQAATPPATATAAPPAVAPGTTGEPPARSADAPSATVDPTAKSRMTAREAAAKSPAGAAEQPATAQPSASAPNPSAVVEQAAGPATAPSSDAALPTKPAPQPPAADDRHAASQSSNAALPTKPAPQPPAADDRRTASQSSKAAPPAKPAPQPPAADDRRTASQSSKAAPPASSLVPPLAANDRRTASQSNSAAPPASSAAQPPAADDRRAASQSNSAAPPASVQPATGQRRATVPASAAARSAQPAAPPPAAAARPEAAPAPNPARHDADELGGRL